MNVICVRDYRMDTGERVFTKGKVYYGQKAGPETYRFTDDEGDPHTMSLFNLFTEDGGCFVPEPDHG